MVVLGATYNISEVLLLELDIAFGCYKVLSWSDTGIITATVIVVGGISLDCKRCFELMREQVGYAYCQGQNQCCNVWKNLAGENRSITGYKCNGTWIKDFVLNPEDTICMAFVYKPKIGISDQGCCGFDIYNPSATTAINVTFVLCPSGEKGAIEIPPLGTFYQAYLEIKGDQACLGCVTETSGPWEYQPCPF